MINYGESVPGPSNMKRVIELQEQSVYLSSFVKDKISIHQNVILLAKGAGAGVTLATAQVLILFFKFLASSHSYF